MDATFSKGYLKLTSVRWYQGKDGWTPCTKENPNFAKGKELWEIQNARTPANEKRKAGEVWQAGEVWKVQTRSYGWKQGYQAGRSSEYTSKEQAQTAGEYCQWLEEQGGRSRAGFTDKVRERWLKKKAKKA